MRKDRVQLSSVLRWLAALGLLLALSAQALAASADQLKAFARAQGIDDAAGFAATIESLERTGGLPPSYLTKGQAQHLGWRPGQDLWAIAPGKSIGGDRFANRERTLPTAPGLRYIEADLDYKGGPRNGKRLIVASDGRYWVTVDHYRSFLPVPR